MTTDHAVPAQPPSAKPRRRIVRRALKYTAALITLLAIAYAALCIWYYRQTPTLSRNFTAELNAETLKIAPEKRAWTHYRQALEVLERQKENELAAQPGENDWPTTAAYLERNAEALAMLREAAKIRPLGILLTDHMEWGDVGWRLRHSSTDSATIGLTSDNPPITDVDLTNHAQLIHCARLLHWDSLLAATEHDAKRMVADITAILDIAQQMAEEPLLIHQLMAISIDGMAFAALGRNLVNSGDLIDDQDLAMFSLRLQSFADTNAFAFRLDAERLAVSDQLQRYYTDDGSGDGVFTIDGELGLTRGTEDEAKLKDRLMAYWNRFRVPIWAAFLLPHRCELHEANEHCFRHVERILRRPRWQRDDEQDLLARELPFDAMIRRWKSDESEPKGTSDLQDMDGWHKQELAGILTALALARHHRAHNQYPTALADLAPGLLREVPVDQFTGKPLLFNLIDNQPTIYSVGADSDDDGGRPPEGKFDPHESGVRNFGSENPPDGDWILFPPYEAPPPAEEPANNDAEPQAEPNEGEPNNPNGDPPTK